MPHRRHKKRKKHFIKLIRASWAGGLSASVKKAWMLLRPKHKGWE